MQKGEVLTAVAFLRGIVSKAEVSNATGDAGIADEQPFTLDDDGGVHPRRTIDAVRLRGVVIEARRSSAKESAVAARRRATDLGFTVGALESEGLMGYLASLYSQLRPCITLRLQAYDDPLAFGSGEHDGSGWKAKFTSSARPLPSTVPEAISWRTSFAVTSMPASRAAL